MDEDIRKERIESETTDLHTVWKKRVISEHIMFIKGVEIIYWEFKEIILALAVHHRPLVDPQTGRMRVVLTKFIEDWFLRRLEPLVKNKIPSKKVQSTNTRKWPESTTDALIKAGRESDMRTEEQERKKQAEREQVEEELRLMAEEDVPAMSQNEIEEI